MLNDVSMRVIREAQMEALAAATTDRFARTLVRQLAASGGQAPGAAETPGDRDLARLAETCVARSRARGLTSETAIIKYANLTLVLGEAFEEKPQTAWAASYFDDDGVPDPDQRMDRVYEEMVRRLEEGPPLLATPDPRPDLAARLRTAGAAAEERRVKGAAGRTVERCPRALTWIRIELLGDEDRGIADAAYVVALPDGSERRGKLDARGQAAVFDISPEGPCDVTFPELDRDAWERRSAG